MLCLLTFFVYKCYFLTEVEFIYKTNVEITSLHGCAWRGDSETTKH